MSASEENPDKCGRGCWAWAMVGSAGASPGCWCHTFPLPSPFILAPVSIAEPPRWHGTSRGGWWGDGWRLPRRSVWCEGWLGERGWGTPARACGGMEASGPSPPLPGLPRVQLLRQGGLQLLWCVTNTRANCISAGFCPLPWLGCD